MPFHRRVTLPLLLFFATCFSTYSVGGLTYAVPVMAILGAHEFGHYLQARRYGVPATFPLFIPFPGSPIGTMGAVIIQGAGWADRKALFDIAVSGPLAGLVLAIPALIYGIQWSTVIQIDLTKPAMYFGEPLVVQCLISLIHGARPEGQDIVLHPVGFAGWVGVFITGLNLLPIGQLDGGHILYALLLRRSHVVARWLLRGAVIAVVVAGSFVNPSYFGWSLMLVLLVMMGSRHPPTADDYVPLGLGRKVIGWATLLFVLIGFTPAPLTIVEPKPHPQPKRIERPEMWVRGVRNHELIVVRSETNPLSPFGRGLG
ncbi:MAG: site-2 protease family protein [Planctomycetales bacterium]|nr:site-2 protease family protein [Planctomycetales bacterium]